MGEEWARQGICHAVAGGEIEAGRLEALEHGRLVGVEDSRDFGAARYSLHRNNHTASP